MKILFREVKVVESFNVLDFENEIFIECDNNNYTILSCHTTIIPQSEKLLYTAFLVR